MADVKRHPKKANATKFKIWTATRNAPGGFMVTEKASVMAGNAQNMIVTDDTGTYISGGGPVAINTSSENIRQGGLWINLNDWLKMVPSTIVTPIPPAIPFPPLAMAFSILKELPFVLSLAV